METEILYKYGQYQYEVDASLFLNIDIVSRETREKRSVYTLLLVMNRIFVFQLLKAEFSPVKIEILRSYRKLQPEKIGFFLV